MWVGVSCDGCAAFHIRKVIWWGPWWGPMLREFGQQDGQQEGAQRWAGSREVFWGGLRSSGVWYVSGSAGFHVRQVT